MRGRTAIKTATFIWVAAAWMCMQPHSPLYAGPLGAPPSCGLYTYKAEIVRVIDGDTVVADIDLGFRTWLHGEHLRLFGIDAPERGTERADKATAALRERVEGKPVYICTIKAKRSDTEKTGSFGRYLVTLYDDAVNINDWLLSQELVEPYQG